MEFDAAKVRQMIEHQKSKYGWEFIFLGANIDAIEVAGTIGIAASHAASFHADSLGTALNFTVVNEAMTSVRASKPLSANWKTEIEKDFQKRGGKSK